MVERPEIVPVCPWVRCDIVPSRLFPSRPAWDMEYDGSTRRVKFDKNNYRLPAGSRAPLPLINAISSYVCEVRADADRALQAALDRVIRMERDIQRAMNVIHFAGLLVVHVKGVVDAIEPVKDRWDRSEPELRVMFFTIPFFLQTIERIRKDLAVVGREARNLSLRKGMRRHRDSLFSELMGRIFMLGFGGLFSDVGVSSFPFKTDNIHGILLTCTDLIARVKLETSGLREQYCMALVNLDTVTEQYKDAFRREGCVARACRQTHVTAGVVRLLPVIAYNSLLDRPRFCHRVIYIHRGFCLLDAVAPNDMGANASNVSHDTAVFLRHRNCALVGVPRIQHELSILDRHISEWVKPGDRIHVHCTAWNFSLLGFLQHILESMRIVVRCLLQGQIVVLIPVKAEFDV